MQRFTYYFAARKDLQPRLPKGPAHYLERFHYDTANAMTIHPLASLTKLVKPTQIVFGTDFPFLTAKATAAGLREVGLFSAMDLQAIERGNAAGLMPRYKYLAPAALVYLAPIIRGSRRLAVQARRISRVDGGGCCGTLATRW